jgi:transposase InsO family protein
MIDNGSGCVSRLFRRACRMLRLRHLRTRPYTPKINGKAEPVIQTLLRERPMLCRTAAPTPAPPTCPGGCATTTTSDPMLASPPDYYVGGQIAAGLGWRRNYQARTSRR